MAVTGRSPCHCDAQGNLSVTGRRAAALQVWLQGNLDVAGPREGWGRAAGCAAAGVCSLDVPGRGEGDEPRRRSDAGYRVTWMCRGGGREPRRRSGVGYGVAWMCGAAGCGLKWLQGTMTVAGPREGWGQGGRAVQLPGSLGVTGRLVSCRVISYGLQGSLGVAGLCGRLQGNLVV